MLGAGKLGCSLTVTLAENQVFHLKNTLLQLSNCDVFLKHLPLYAIKYLVNFIISSSAENLNRNL